MKKIKYVIILFVAFFLANPTVKAANITTNASTVYPGQSFVASVTINAAAWNIKISSTGPVSGCSIIDPGDSGTALNVNKTVSTTCTATGTGVITISLSGDYTTQDGNTVDVSGTTSVQVVEQPAPPPAPVPSQQPQQQKPQQQKPSTPQQQPQKSSNNFLKSLNVEGCSISPKFDKNTLEYSCKDLLIDKITINAEVEDSKSTISGTGTKELSNGDNNFEVHVRSEDGQVRVYKLLINKKNIPTTKILSISLGNTEYKFKGENILFGIPAGTTSLDLKVKTESISAKVNIIGNENLKPGNNIIEISVTDTGCKEKVYKVLVYIQENDILENQDIQSLDKNYTVNLRKNSAYLLNKNLLSKIGANKILYNIIDQNYGLLSSIEINTKKELEEDYELYFMVNDDKIYTNIFKDTSIKAYMGTKYKKGEKLYIYEYNNETRKYNKLDEQKYNDYYVSFRTTDSFEYLITNKLITKEVPKEKSISILEIILIVVSQIIIMSIIIILFTNRFKNNYKQLSEESISKNTTSEQAVDTTSKQTEDTTEVI